MTSPQGSHAWGALVAATLGGVLLSLVPLQRSQGALNGPDCSLGNCSSLNCDVGTVCAFDGDGCACLTAFGCCQFNSTFCNNSVAELNCTGQFSLAGVCGEECRPPTDTPTSTPTSTPTNTPTATPTNTRVPNGGGCDDPADCNSGNCVDDVCCEEASCPPGESCDNPGNAGNCSPDPTAPAPAISRSGVLVALALLVAIGGFAVLRRRRGTS